MIATRPRATLGLFAVSLLACSSGEGSGTASSSGSGPTEPPAACGPVGDTWTRCAKNPLATSGHVHADGRIELAVGDPDVFFDEDDQIWKAWWSTTLATAFGAPEDSLELGIKYAESADGVAWTIQEDLALAADYTTDEWDQLKLETPSVVKVPTNPPDRRYVLAYAGAGEKRTVTIGGQSASIAWYEIGIAFSPDGKSFTRLALSESAYAGVNTGYAGDGLALLATDMLADTPGVADGLLADPELVLKDGTLHLFTSSMAVDANRVPLNFGVSHATSMDGVHWAPQARNPQISGGAQPSVVANAMGEFELFTVEDTNQDKLTEPSSFNPFVGVWRRTSTDLTTWSPRGAMRDFTWDGTQKTEIYGLIAAGDMALRDGVYRYYYPGWSADAVPSGFVCPLNDGTLVPGVIVLNLALRR